MTVPFTLCWIDGEGGAAVDAFDRGLAYGDGVFETMRFAGSRIPLETLHLARLERGCERLGIPVCMDRIREHLDSALREAVVRLPAGVLKLIVTRGSGGRGYRVPHEPQPRHVMLAMPLPVHPSEWETDGVAVRFCDLRLGSNPVLAGIKHLNRLEQVLARREWDDPDIAEGLLADSRGRIVEAISSNVFLVSGGRLLTPLIDTCGVAGVMRQHVLSVVAPRLGIQATEVGCERAMLGGAQEIFLCNSVFGIWPVSRLADRRLPVGQFTQRIQSDVAALFAA